MVAPSQTRHRDHLPIPAHASPDGHAETGKPGNDASKKQVPFARTAVVFEHRQRLVSGNLTAK